MDLSWDTLDYSQNAEARNSDQASAETSLSKLDLPESERQYSNLERLNANLSTIKPVDADKSLKSVRLDLGLAYWEQPLLAPEVLSAMPWSQDLVPTDDDFEDPDTVLAFSDPKSEHFMDAKRTSENERASMGLPESFVALGLHEPRIIGTLDHDTGSESSSSDEDGHVQNDPESSASEAEHDDGPIFQRFDNSYKGVRRLVPKPAPGIILLHGDDNNSTDATTNNPPTHRWSSVLD